MLCKKGGLNVFARNNNTCNLHRVTWAKTFHCLTELSAYQRIMSHDDSSGCLTKRIFMKSHKDDPHIIMNHADILSHSLPEDRYFFFFFDSRF